MIPGAVLAGLSPDVLDQPLRPARVVETITGASYVTLDVPPDPKILATVLASPSGMTLNGRRWRLVAATLVATRTRLVWEDDLVTRLRAQDTPLSVPAGATTLAELVTRLAVEAGVAYDVAPSPARIPTAVQRTDSWSTIQALAPRCWSDGTTWVVGSDTWLLDRADLAEVSEGSGGVNRIQVHVDHGKPESRTRLLVDATWPGRVGDAFTLPVLDDTPWLVTGRTYDVGADVATITATRATQRTEGVVPW